MLLSLVLSLHKTYHVYRILYLVTICVSSLRGGCVCVCVQVIHVYSRFSVCLLAATRCNKLQHINPKKLLQLMKFTQHHLRAVCLKLSPEVLNLCFHQ